MANPMEKQPMNNDRWAAEQKEIKEKARAKEIAEAEAKIEEIHQKHERFVITPEMRAGARAHARRIESTLPDRDKE